MVPDHNKCSSFDGLHRKAVSCDIRSALPAWCLRLGFASAEVRILAFCLCINFLLFCILFHWIVPAYETNDDLCMQLISSGFFDGQPSEHLVFTSVLIGWPLRLLYIFCRGFNWYACYLICVQFTAVSAMFFLALRRSRRWSTVWIYLCFFCLVQIRMLVELQFTTTAFLAGATGIFLLAEGLSVEKVRWNVFVAGVLFVGLATMIREAVVPLLCAIAVPFLVSLTRSVRVRRLIWAGGIAAAVTLLLGTVNRWYYERSPDWSRFIAYNRFRGEIHGTPLTKGLPQAVAHVGWTKNDGELFRRFYFAEPDVYNSTTKIQVLLNDLKALRPSRLQSLQKEFFKCWFLPDAFPRDSAWLMKLALLTAIGCLVLVRSDRPIRALTFAATYGVLFLLSVYLRSTARLPERVAFTMPLFLSCLCLYWLTSPASPVTSLALEAALNRLAPTLTRPHFIRALKLSTLGCCAALFGPCVFHYSEGWWYSNAFNRDARISAATLFDRVAPLVQSGQKAVVVAMPDESALEWCLPFVPPGKKPFSLVPYGWPTHSPIFQRVLAQNHLKPYSLSLLDRADVLFCMDDHWQVPLQTFYREHYGRNVGFELALCIEGIPNWPGHQFRLYRAHTISTFGNKAHRILEGELNPNENYSVGITSNQPSPGICNEVVQGCGSTIALPGLSGEWTSVLGYFEPSHGISNSSGWKQY